MKILLDALLELRRRAPEIAASYGKYAPVPFNHRSGICNNVINYLCDILEKDPERSYELSDEGYRQLRLAEAKLSELICHWPAAYYGDYTFPVGGGNEYLNKSQLWTNPRRLALLDWLIEELENGD